MNTAPGMMPQHPPAYNAVHIAWSWLMTIGVILLVLGSLAIIFPAATSVSVSVFIGILFLIAGFSRVVHVFSSTGWADFLFRVLASIVFLAAGILLLARPIEGTLTLTVLLVIFFAAQGVVNIVTALTSSMRGRGWLLFNGLLALVLGGLIWAELPSSASWAIGLLVGIYLIFDGWALIASSLALHSAEKEPMTS